jgi:hypothetical protein
VVVMAPQLMLVVARGPDDPPAGEDDLAGLSKDRLCTGGASGIAATACCAADRQRESAGSRTVSAVWVLLSTPKPESVPRASYNNILRKEEIVKEVAAKHGHKLFAAAHVDAGD